MISRQRRWQLKQRENGLCVKCPKPCKTNQFCEYHANKRVQYSAKHYKTNPQCKPKQKIYGRQYRAKKTYGDLWECQVIILTINDEVRRIKCQN